MAIAQKSVYSSYSTQESVFSCFSRKISFHFQIDFLKQLIEVKFDGEGEILAQEHVLQFTCNFFITKFYI